MALLAVLIAYLSKICCFGRFTKLYGCCISLGYLMVFCCSFGLFKIHFYNTFLPYCLIWQFYKLVKVWEPCSIYSVSSGNSTHILSLSFSTSRYFKYVLYNTNAYNSLLIFLIESKVVQEISSHNLYATALSL